MPAEDTCLVTVGRKGDQVSADLKTVLVLPVKTLL